MWVCALISCYVGLLSVRLSSGIPIEKIQTALSNTGGEDEWFILGTTLSVGRGHSSVVFLNGSLLVVGGCTDWSCKNHVGAVDVIDVDSQKVVQHFSLPGVLYGDDSTEKMNSTKQPIVLAGPTAAVRVDDAGGTGNPALFIVGPCIYYSALEQPENASITRERYSTIFQLSNDLRSVEYRYKIGLQRGGPNQRNGTSNISVKARPGAESLFRVNASCVSRGSLILIIGGVNVDTGEALRSVDVYDTKRRQYIENPFSLKEAVQRPLVAVDSKLLYIAGGEKQELVRHPKSLHQSFGSDTGAGGVPHKQGNFTVVGEMDDNDNETLKYWSPSASVQAVMLKEDLMDNDEDSTAFFVGDLPPNAELLVSIDGKQNGDNHMFTVNGELCVFVGRGIVNCLDIVEYFSMNYPREKASDLWKPVALIDTPPPSEASSPFTFMFPAGVLGTVLVLMNVGGFDPLGQPSNLVSYHVGGVFVASVTKIDMIKPINEPLRIVLQPPCSGHVRLSRNFICNGNAAATNDTEVVTTEDKGAVAVFYPTKEEELVYVCFARSSVSLSLKCFDKSCALLENTYIFTPITITPFHIRNKSSDDPSGGGTGAFQLVLVGIALSLSMLVVVCASVTSFARLRTFPAVEGDLSSLLLNPGVDADDVIVFNAVNNRCRERKALGYYPHAGKDCNAVACSPDTKQPPAESKKCKTEVDWLVKNTTQDSKYEVVRRIGKGAFSFVYLVRRKSDGREFALKYLICRDNKERLDALRECETINSVQGHPNIIRIVEMFMNYEFNAEPRLSPPVEVARGKVDGAARVSPLRLPLPATPNHIVSVGRHGPSLRAGLPLKFPPCADSLDKQKRQSGEDSRAVSMPHGGGATMLPQKEKSHSSKCGVLEGGQPSAADAPLCTPELAGARGGAYGPTYPASQSCPSPEPHVVGLCNKDAAAASVFTQPDPSPNTKNAAIQYPNFPMHFQLDKEKAGDGHFPEDGVRYRNFDASLQAPDGTLLRVTPSCNVVSPTVVQHQREQHTWEAADHRQAQPTVGFMQYKNFAAASTVAGRETSQEAGGVIKLGSVADAVRAARNARNSERSAKLASVVTGAAGGVTQALALSVRQDLTATAARPSSVTPTKAQCPPPPPVDRSCVVGEGNRQFHVVGHHGREYESVLAIKEERLQKLPALIPRSPRAAAVAAEAASTPLLGASDSQSVHTRYLALVMENHPTGDLCGYVVRHCTIHNPKLRRRLEKEKALAIQACRANTDNIEGGAVMVGIDHVRSSPSEAADNIPYSLQKGTESSGTASPMVHIANGCVENNPTEGRFVVEPSELIARNKIEKDFIMRENAFTEPQLLSIAYQLSSVLSYLHSHRPPIVHRDLKPENILISGDVLQHDDGSDRRIRYGEGLAGEGVGNSRKGSKAKDPLRCRSGCSVKLTVDVIPIVVTDFGLAFVLEGRRSACRGGGTRPYIAPECWVGQTSTASDIWSLGCVLYALATGRVTVSTVRLMYEEAERDGFAAMVMNDILNRGYSLEFASFVVSLLVVNPSRRPSAQMALQCFTLVSEEGKDDVVKFDHNCPFFTNVREL
ncbi:Kelch motifProtein kinase domain [Trypanosoma vivax]|nr:Kelch motifProtein kinase domain [Trypanosoma vivax]